MKYFYYNVQFPTFLKIPDIDFLFVANDTFGCYLGYWRENGGTVGKEKMWRP